MKVVQDGLRFCDECACCRRAGELRAKDGLLREGPGGTYTLLSATCALLNGADRGEVQVSAEQLGAFLELVADMCDHHEACEQPEHTIEHKVYVALGHIQQTLAQAKRDHRERGFAGSIE